MGQSQVAMGWDNHKLPWDGIDTSCHRMGQSQVAMGWHVIEKKKKVSYMDKPVGNSCNKILAGTCLHSSPSLAF